MKFLLLAAALAFAGRATASDLDFRLENRTIWSFEGVYISATDDKDWNGNLLPDGVILAAGEDLPVRFESKAKSQTWDICLVDDIGRSVTFRGVNLAGADALKVRVIDGKIVAEIR